MGQTMRVSLPGYNVLTDTNLDHYALYTDEDNVLIKEKARGSFNAAAGTTTAIAHNLGYIPYVQVFTDIGSKRYVLYGYTTTAVPDSIYLDTSNLYILNNGTTSITGTYFIFYDNQT